MYLAHYSAERKQPLHEHLLEVSRLTGEMAQRCGLERAGTAIGLLHDLGKYSGAFQSYLIKTQESSDDTPERGSVNHSSAGAQVIWRSLHGGPSAQSATAEVLAICIASHHSGMIDCLSASGENSLRQKMERSEDWTHVGEALANCDTSVRSRIESILHDPALVEETASALGRILKSASQSPTTARFQTGLLARFLFSCLVDGDRSDTAAFAEPLDSGPRRGGRYLSWQLLVERLEKQLAQLGNDNTAVSALRRGVSQACRQAAERPAGIYTLTVPTGGGKTLASLRFALHHVDRLKLERVIYVSPYISIIDQNAQVIRDVLESDEDAPSSVVLEHHSNLAPCAGTRLARLLAENWDAPIVCTTAVQFLESLFGAGTRAVRRMHRMARSVIVFDEIQTLPVRCVHMFNNAINFLQRHCGTTVLFCTATQPLLHLVYPAKGAIELSNNAELMPDVSTLFTELRRTTVYNRVRQIPWQLSEVAELAIAETATAASCLLVVNTKTQAKSLYDECKRSTEVRVVYLSTNLCPAHRRNILREMSERLKQREPLICVSTQLIEAGVDISFGAAIRALAGLDSIAQTAGRCNRNGESSIGNVYVVNLKGEDLSRLVDIRKAQDAASRILRECGELLDLSDVALMERYFEYYFFDRRNEMDYPVSPPDAERSDTLLRMLSDNTLAVAEAADPRLTFRASFMTAAKLFEPIDSKAQGVIVPYGDDGPRIIAELVASHEPKQQYRLLRQAQQYSVNVFPHVLKALAFSGALQQIHGDSGIYYVDSRYYDPECGLDPHGTGEMETVFA